MKHLAADVILVSESLKKNHPLKEGDSKKWCALENGYISLEMLGI